MTVFYVAGNNTVNLLSFDADIYDIPPFRDFTL